MSLVIYEYVHYVGRARIRIEATESVPRAVASGVGANRRSLPLAVLTQPMPCEFQTMARRVYRNFAKSLSPTTPSH